MTTSVGYLIGSLAGLSINRQLANHVLSKAPAGIDFEEIPIQELPLYNYDLDGDPPAAALTFKQQIEAHDVLLFVTPEYNRSIPGALKNAIDWGSRPWGNNSWDGRRAAIIGTGLNGAGTAVAQSHLRSILVYLGVTVLGTPELCVPWQEGVLTASTTAEYVDAFWARFSASVRHADVGP